MTAFDAVIDTPIGRIGIRLHESRVCAIEFLTARCPLRPAANTVSRRAVAALDAYFADAGGAPAVAVVFNGTGFQNRVWTALQEIPAGQVLTYGALARRLGSGARAVGGACRRNPVPILVPCHRVVAASGLGGFAGDTGGRLVDIKRRLLTHEGVEIAALSPHIDQ